MQAETMKNLVICVLGEREHLALPTILGFKVRRSRSNMPTCIRLVETTVIY